jgi:transcriptional regulator with XRE-family HTH domain
MWRFDAASLSRELVRTLRGPQSQTAMSRRLGHRSNVFYAWESGRRFPSASELFRLAHKRRADVAAALAAIGVRDPDRVDVRTPAGIAALLADVRRDVRINDIAARTGESRFMVSRWLRGLSEPRLPELFVLLEALTLRLVELLAALVGPDAIPAVAREWRGLDARRRIAFTHPWSQAILRVIETEQYKKSKPRSGSIAKRLGIDPAIERACLEALLAAGLVRAHGAHYRAEPTVMDSSAGSEADRLALKQHWLDVGRARLGAGDPGLFSWSVFAVSQKDFEEMRALHVRYMHALRGLIDASQPSEIVGVANVQLFELRALPVAPVAGRRTIEPE